MSSQGKVYPSCIASNSNSTYFLTRANNTHTDRERDPLGNFALFKTDYFKVKPGQLAWTGSWDYVAYVPVPNEKLFKTPASYYRSLSEHTTCAVDDNGAFAFSSGLGEEGVMYTLLYEPKPPGKSTEDKWSVLDPVSIGQMNREFYLFFANDLKNNSSILHHVYRTYESNTTTPTSSPALGGDKNNTTPITLRTGQMLSDGNTSSKSHSFNLNNLGSGTLRRLFVGNGNLYADISRSQTTSAPETTGNVAVNTNRDLSAYPLSSLTTANVSAPAAPAPLWLKDCEYPVSAASGGVIYTICDNGDHDELTIVNGTVLISTQRINRPPSPNSRYYRLEVAPSPPGKLAPVAYLTTQSAIYTVYLDEPTLAYLRFEEVYPFDNGLVTPDDTPVSESGRGITSTTIIIICVVVVACLALFGGLFLYFRRRRRHQYSASKEELK